MIERLCRIAAAAGDLILRFYKQPTHVVTTKTDKSPLSEADQTSHNYLVEQLKILSPEWPVRSEEFSEIQNMMVSSAERYWLIDPLDGTKEFLKGTHEFTVNIALIQGRRPILGVVCAPAMNLTYFGGNAVGAWRKNGGEAPTRIHTRPANPSRLAIVASKDHAGPQISMLLARAPSAELKSIGSSLKFCLVAEGAADLYLRDLPTMEWDTGAAQAVVEAAGGLVCDLEGAPLEYGKNGMRNPAIITVGDPECPWKGLLR